MFSQKSNIEPERFWNAFPPEIKYITHPQKNFRFFHGSFLRTSGFFEAFFLKTNKTGGLLILHPLQSMEPEALLSSSTNKEPAVLITRSTDRPEPEVLISRSIITRTEPEVIIFRSIIGPKPEVPHIPQSGKDGTGGSQKG